MVEDNSYISQDKSLKSSRQGKQDINLFPALSDKSRVTPLSASRTTALGTQISIFTPVTFEEALDIVECLRSRAATTISLENMKKIDANRLVDFVAGASAALDGDFHKLSEQVYIFCPSNIRITAPGKQVAAPQFTGSFETPGALDFLYPSAHTDSSSTTTWPN
ncbi:MAG TPA: cell division protein SepF [Planktothrix sp.]|jgi:FtsZ-interacting cell division protein YlmF